MTRTLEMYDEMKGFAKYSDHSLRSQAWFWLLCYYEEFGYPEEYIKEYINSLDEEGMVLSCLITFTGEDYFEDYRKRLIYLVNHGRKIINEHHCLSEEEILKMSQLKVVDLYSSYYMRHRDIEENEFCNKKGA